MKRLPVGRQNFAEIINEDLLYIDKTHIIYQLTQYGKLYFLSRPRRFGKSLLISMFRYLFEGRKDLFKDLYIGQKTDYQFDAYPILQFNFASLGHKVLDLEERLNRLIFKYADEFGVHINKSSISENFTNLVSGIAQKGQPVVLLVDEYDKPIIDFFTEIEQAKKNQRVLRNFFSPLKDLDAQGDLRFLFITGVSKFSKVSLFSDLNNLTDLSLHPMSHDLLGITHEELKDNFQPHLAKLSKQFKLSVEELLGHIKNWYNGYSYDGEIKLCNPFSLLSFFHAGRFSNYWFATGTPTFLVETIRNEDINPEELEHVEVEETFFVKFSLEHLDIIGLLYQTGYLTIKKVESSIYETRYFLGYPNLEVQKAMEHNLVEAFTYKPASTVSNAMIKMQRGLKNGDLGLFINFLKVILSNLKYNWQPPRQYKTQAELFRMWEGYFHAVIYLITSYMSISIKSEIQTNKGRIDLMAETDKYLYLMEFKLDQPAQDAIKQIKNRDYINQYSDTDKTIYLVGIGFSQEERNVESWESEIWKP